MDGLPSDGFSDAERNNLAVGHIVTPTPKGSGRLFHRLFHVTALQFRGLRGGDL